MDLSYYAYLARTLSPLDLVAAVGRRASRAVRGQLGRVRANHPLRSLIATARREENKRRELIERAGPAQPKLILPEAREATARVLRERWPEACAAILAEAEAARDGVLPIYGKPVHVAAFSRGAREPTAPLAYDRDPLTLARYDSNVAGTHVNLFVKGSDAKTAWEVGRLSHLWRYGQARWLATTADERSVWARAWLHTLRQFNARNPIGCGVQWSCAMEVSARAMHVALSFGLVLDDPVIDATARAELMDLLNAHGRFIEHHLEDGGAVRTNHYAADLVGLVVIGALFPELERAHRYRGWAAQALWEEILRECRPDGTHFESSTGYQRLVAELFLNAVLAARAGGMAAPQEVELAVASLFRSLSELVKPSGRAPQIGDFDSVRGLPLVPRAVLDMSYFAPLGAAALCDPSIKGEGEACPPEVAWLCGASGVLLYDALPAKGVRKSRVLRDAGIAVLREREAYLVISAGPNGQGGLGGHGHNDKNSVELEWAGHDLIVDRGTFVYARDPAQRNARRSTAGHSTVQVDSLDQNRIHENRLFALPDLSQARILDLWSREGVEVARGEHHGYARVGAGVTHRRSAALWRAARGAAFVDELLGQGDHVFDSRWYVPNPEVRLREAGGAERARLEQLQACRAVPLPLDARRCIEVAVEGKAIALFAFGGSLEYELSIEETDVSPGYGELKPARCLHVRAAGRAPATLCCAVLFL